MESLVIKSLLPENVDVAQNKLQDDIVIDCTPESTAQLLALAVDHIDILLEDWYPTLGTRFVHTSEGKFLVTRLVPCPRCLQLSVETEQNNGTNDQAKSLPEVTIKFNMHLIVYCIHIALTLIRYLQRFFYDEGWDRDRTVSSWNQVPMFHSPSAHS